MGEHPLLQRWWSPGLKGAPHHPSPSPFLSSYLDWLPSVGHRMGQCLRVCLRARLALLNWGSPRSVADQPFLGSPLCHEEP